MLASSCPSSSSVALNCTNFWHFWRAHTRSPNAPTSCAQERTLQPAHLHRPAASPPRAHVWQQGSTTTIQATSLLLAPHTTALLLKRFLSCLPPPRLSLLGDRSANKARSLRHACATQARIMIVPFNGGRCCRRPRATAAVTQAACCTIHDDAGSCRLLQHHVGTRHVTPAGTCHASDANAQPRSPATNT